MVVKIVSPSMPQHTVQCNQIVLGTDSPYHAFLTAIHPIDRVAATLQFTNDLVAGDLVIFNRQYTRHAYLVRPSNVFSLYRKRFHDFRLCSMLSAAVAAPDDVFATSRCE
jgi:hypothetical protein